eukprot:13652419-Ditylum_brightwellii.AAC.1
MIWKILIFLTPVMIAALQKASEEPHWVPVIKENFGSWFQCLLSSCLIIPLDDMELSIARRE